MNLKAVLMLCVIIFAFASTVATITIALGSRTPNVFGTTRSISYIIDSGQVQPTGDPIDDDEFAPM